MDYATKQTLLVFVLTNYDRLSLGLLIFQGQNLFNVKRLKSRREFCSIVILCKTNLERVIDSNNNIY